MDLAPLLSDLWKDSRAPHAKTFHAPTSSPPNGGIGEPRRARRSVVHTRIQLAKEVRKPFQRRPNLFRLQ